MDEGKQFFSSVSNCHIICHCSYSINFQPQTKSYWKFNFKMVKRVNGEEKEMINLLVEDKNHNESITWLSKPRVLLKHTQYIGLTR